MKFTTDQKNKLKQQLERNRGSNPAFQKAINIANRLDPKKNDHQRIFDALNAAKDNPLDLARLVAAIDAQKMQFRAEPQPSGAGAAAAASSPAAPRARAATPVSISSPVSRGTPISSGPDGSDDSDVEGEFLFDIASLNTDKSSLDSRYSPALKAVNFKNPDLYKDFADEERLKELKSFSEPSFYQLSVSGELPNLEAILRHFKDGKISPAFQQDLENINTRVLIKLLHKTSDVYNQKLDSNQDVPGAKQAIQCLLFEAIKKTIADFDDKQQVKLKGVSDPAKIQAIKRETLAEKISTVAGLVNLVKNKGRETEIAKRANRLEILRQQLLQQEHARRTPALGGSPHLSDKELRQPFTDNINAISTEIERNKSEIDGLRKNTVLENFADFKSHNLQSVGDIMEEMYDSAYGDYVPTDDDKDILKQLHLLSAVELQVGRRQLLDHYNRILKNLGVKSPADITYKTNQKERDFYHYKRLRHVLFDMRNKLFGSYDEPMMSLDQLDSYMDSMVLNTGSGKVSRKTLPVGQDYSLLVDDRNRPLCSIGGARRALDEGGKFADALLINKGNFGDIKLAFNPITGKAYAVKKETRGKWVDRKKEGVDFYLRNEGKAEFQDESKPEEFTRERQVEERVGLSRGVIVRGVTELTSEQYVEDLEKRLGRKLKLTEKRDLVKPARLKPDAKARRQQVIPTQYHVMLTPMELLKGVQDMKDDIEDLDLESRDDRTAEKYNLDQCSSRLDMAIDFIEGAYDMMANKRILHFDIKPKNFQGIHFDFGTSRIVAGTEDFEGAVHTLDILKGGTPEYFAPEFYARANLRQITEIEAQISKIEKLQKLKTSVEEKEGIKFSVRKELEQKTPRTRLYLTLMSVARTNNIDFTELAREIGIPIDIGQYNIINEHVRSEVDQKINEFLGRDYTAELDTLNRKLQETSNVTANYKADIYSIGASVFGIVHAGTYLNMFMRRKNGIFPDVHIDSQGNKFKVSAKNDDGSFTAVYLKETRKGNLVEDKSKVQFVIKKDDYIPIGKEFSEGVTDLRGEQGKKGFESGGIRILDWAMKVAANNPKNKDAQKIVDDLNQIKDALITVNPGQRASLNPEESADLDNGTSLFEIIQRLKNVKARLEAIESNSLASAERMYALLQEVDSEVAKANTAAKKAGLENGLMVAKISPETLRNNEAKGMPLINILIGNLPDQHVAPVVSRFFDKISPLTIRNLFKESPNHESPLLVAIKSRKPRVVSAIIAKLPEGVINDILSNPEFNKEFVENQWLLHHLSRENLTPAIDSLLGKARLNVSDTQAVNTKLLQNPFAPGTFPLTRAHLNLDGSRIEYTKFNPVQWAIYHKNRELLERYCAMLSARDLISYRFYNAISNVSSPESYNKLPPAESIFHFAVREKNKQALDLLMRKTGLSYNQLCGAEFLSASQEYTLKDGSKVILPGVGPFYWAFEDNPEIVQDLISKIGTPDFMSHEDFMSFITDSNNIYGAPPLFLAIKGNNLKLLESIFQYIDKPESNLDARSKLEVFANTHDANSNHALLYAARNNNLSAFKKIVDYCFDGDVDKDEKISLVNKLFISKSEGEDTYSLFEFLVMDPVHSNNFSGQEMLFYIREKMQEAYGTKADDIFLQAIKEAFSGDRNAFFDLASSGRLDVLDFFAVKADGTFARETIAKRDEKTGDGVFHRLFTESNQGRLKKSFANIVAAGMRGTISDARLENAGSRLIKANLLTNNVNGVMPMEKIVEHGDRFLIEILEQLRDLRVTFTQDELKIIKDMYESQYRTKLLLPQGTDFTSLPAITRPSQRSARGGAGAGSGGIDFAREGGLQAYLSRQTQNTNAERFIPVSDAENVARNGILSEEARAFDSIGIDYKDSNEAAQSKAEARVRAEDASKAQAVAVKNSRAQGDVVDNEAQNREGLVDDEKSARVNLDELAARGNLAAQAKGVKGDTAAEEARAFADLVASANANQDSVQRFESARDELVAQAKGVKGDTAAEEARAFADLVASANANQDSVQRFEAARDELVAQAKGVKGDTAAEEARAFADLVASANANQDSVQRFEAARDELVAQAKGVKGDTAAEEARAFADLVASANANQDSVQRFESARDELVAQAKGVKGDTAAEEARAFADLVASANANQDSVQRFESARDELVAQAKGVKGDTAAEEARAFADLVASANANQDSVQRFEAARDELVAQAKGVKGDTAAEEARAFADLVASANANQDSVQRFEAARDELVAQAKGVKGDTAAEEARAFADLVASANANQDSVQRFEAARDELVAQAKGVKGDTAAEEARAFADLVASANANQDSVQRFESARDELVAQAKGVKGDTAAEEARAFADLVASANANQDSVQRFEAARDELVAQAKGVKGDTAAEEARAFADLVASANANQDSVQRFEAARDELVAQAKGVKGDTAAEEARAFADLVASANANQDSVQRFEAARDELVAQAKGVKGDTAAEEARAFADLVASANANQDSVQRFEAARDELVAQAKGVKGDTAAEEARAFADLVASANANQDSVQRFEAARDELVAQAKGVKGDTAAEEARAFADLVASANANQDSVQRFESARDELVAQAKGVKGDTAAEEARAFADLVASANANQDSVQRFEAARDELVAQAKGVKGDTAAEEARAFADLVASANANQDSVQRFEAARDELVAQAKGVKGDTAAEEARAFADLVASANANQDSVQRFEAARDELVAQAKGVKGDTAAEEARAFADLVASANANQDSVQRFEAARDELVAQAKGVKGDTAAEEARAFADLVASANANQDSVQRFEAARDELVAQAKGVKGDTAAEEARAFADLVASANANQDSVQRFEAARDELVAQAKGVKGDTAAEEARAFADLVASANANQDSVQRFEAARDELVAQAKGVKGDTAAEEARAFADLVASANANQDSVQRFEAARDELVAQAKGVKGDTAAEEARAFADLVASANANQDSVQRFEAARDELVAQADGVKAETAAEEAAHRAAIKADEQEDFAALVSNFSDEALKLKALADAQAASAKREADDDTSELGARRRHEVESGVVATNGLEAEEAAHRAAIKADEQEDFAALVSNFSDEALKLKALADAQAASAKREADDDTSELEARRRHEVESGVVATNGLEAEEAAHRAAIKADEQEDFAALVSNFSDEALKLKALADAQAASAKREADDDTSELEARRRHEVESGVVATNGLEAEEAAHRAAIKADEQEDFAALVSNFSDEALKLKALADAQAASAKREADDDTSELEARRRHEVESGVVATNGLEAEEAAHRAAIKADEQEDFAALVSNFSDEALKLKALADAQAASAKREADDDTSELEARRRHEVESGVVATNGLEAEEAAHRAAIKADEQEDFAALVSNFSDEALKLKALADAQAASAKREADDDTSELEARRRHEVESGVVATNGLEAEEAAHRAAIKADEQEDFAALVSNFSDEALKLKALADAQAASAKREADDDTSELEARRRHEVESGVVATNGLEAEEAAHRAAIKADEQEDFAALVSNFSDEALKLKALADAQAASAKREADDDTSELEARRRHEVESGVVATNGLEAEEAAHRAAIKADEQEDFAALVSNFSDEALKLKAQADAEAAAARREAAEDDSYDDGESLKLKAQADAEAAASRREAAEDDSYDDGESLKLKAQADAEAAAARREAAEDDSYDDGESLKLKAQADAEAAAARREAAEDDSYDDGESLKIKAAQDAQAAAEKHAEQEDVIGLVDEEDISRSDISGQEDLAREELLARANIEKDELASRAALAHAAPRTPVTRISRTSNHSSSSDSEDGLDVGGCKTEKPKGKALTFKTYLGQEYTARKNVSDGVRVVANKKSNSKKDPVLLVSDMFEMARRAGSKPGMKPEISINDGSIELVRRFYVIAKAFEEQGLVIIKMSDELRAKAEEDLASAKEDIYTNFSAKDNESLVENFTAVYSANSNSDNEVVNNYFANRADKSDVTEDAKQETNTKGGLFNAVHAYDADNPKKDNSIGLLRSETFFGKDDSGNNFGLYGEQERAATAQTATEYLDSYQDIRKHKAARRDV